MCIVGDGGLTMLMGEIATLVKYKLTVKVIVIKNNVLGQIKWEQMVMEGNPEFGVELQPIDFAGIRDELRRRGIHHRRSRRGGEHSAAERWRIPGLRWSRRWWIPNEPPLPGNITTEQALKFAEALGKRGKRPLEDY